MIEQFLNIIYAIFILIPTAFVTYFVTNYLISYYTKKNMTVRDVTKPGVIMVPRPAGPGIISGIVTGGLFTYVIFPHNEILLLLISTSIAFIIGFIDDKRTMKGWFKPTMLILSSIPMLLLVFNGNDLSIPSYGFVSVPILYGAFIFLSMPFIGNTSNSFDAFNGMVSKSFVIALFVLFSSMIFLNRIGISNYGYELHLVGCILVVFSVFYLKFHKLPTRIFPGDSGSITIGVVYFGLAIITHLEIIAIIAILPAILNSFIFLSSTKKIVEHRELKGTPISLTSDYKLRANKEKSSVSLIRLILTKGELTEKQTVNQIHKFMIFSGFLAIGTTVSYFVSPISIIITLAVGLVLILKSKYVRLYMFVLFTWLMIIGMFPLINIISNLDWYIQPIVIVPVIGVFIIGLILLKRHILKPLYKELE